jgi:histidine ammonia-lyase
MRAYTVGGRLSPDDVARVAAGVPIELDRAALDRVAANRAVLEELVDSDLPIYGITTGFGALVSQHVPRELHRELQRNLLRSHAAGTGAPLPRDVVRAALVVRLNGLVQGYSGIRPLVLERVAALLNAGFVPVVPRTGSLGASGDLAPSAHAFLPLIGEGHVYDEVGRLMSGADALAALGLEPLTLEAKEGLALINGTHFMAGIGALLTVRVRALLDTADVAAAATVDALRGARSAFDARVHALRPVPGQITSAANIDAALDGSSRVRGRDHATLQDAYSVRCAAQVHGAAREGYDFFARLVAIDLNAVTDNPLVLSDPPDVISAGNFHGQSLALAFDTLKLALADVASISERRLFRLLAPSLNGALPGFLTAAPGPSSGYMIVQYVAAALLTELRALAHPVSIDNVPTSDNQEDHVSMGMTAAVMALEAVERVEKILAYELLCACQALDLDPDRGGRVVESAHAAVREAVPMLAEDRPPADDLEALLPLVSSGRLAGLLRDAPRATGVAA